MSTTAISLVEHTSEANKSLTRLQSFFTGIETRLAQIRPVDTAPMLELKVTDASSAVTAKQDKAEAKRYIEDVESLLAEPTSIAFQVHRSFTGLKNNLTADARAVIEHHDKAVSVFVRQEEENRLQLERELQAKADAYALEVATRKAAEDEQARQAQLAEAMPWDKPVAAPGPVPVVVAVPRIELPAMPIASGFSKRYAPWTFELKDIKELCRAVADGKADPECLLPNGPFLTTAARLYKDKLAEKFPGVEGIHPLKDKY